MWSFRLLVAALATLPACAAEATDFALVEIRNEVAHVVALPAAKSRPTAVARLDLYSARRTVASDGRTVYGRMSYAFKCLTREMRGEGMRIYDSRFGQVFARSDTSPWRPLPASYDMPALFDLACRGTAPSGMQRLSAGTWQEALEEARRKIR